MNNVSVSVLEAVVWTRRIRQTLFQRGKGHWKATGHKRPLKETPRDDELFRSLIQWKLSAAIGKTSELVEEFYDNQMKLSSAVEDSIQRRFRLEKGESV